MHICALIFVVESGGFTWEGILKGTLEEECPADELPKSLSSTINTDNIDKTVIQTAEEVQLALGSLKQVMSWCICKKKHIFKFYYNHRNTDASQQIISHDSTKKLCFVYYRSLPQMCTEAS